jgi:Na+/phosphate symporter
MPNTLKDLFPNATNEDKRSASFILSKLAEKQKPGFDYLRFKRSLKAMEKLPMDEATRFQSAFAAALALDVSKEELMKTAQYYIDYLKQEKGRFAEEAELRMVKKVKDREQQVVHVQEMIDKYREKVQQLQEQISNYEAKVIAAKSEMDEERQRIDSSLVLFNTTCDLMMQDIEADLEKLSTYLG